MKTILFLVVTSQFKLFFGLYKFWHFWWQNQMQNIIFHFCYFGKHFWNVNYKNTLFRPVNIQTTRNRMYWRRKEILHGNILKSLKNIVTHPLTYMSILFLAIYILYIIVCMRWTLFLDTRHLYSLVQIDSVTTDIFLIWTNVARTNVALQMSP